MRYLLDTNVLSDIRRGSSSSLQTWIAEQRVTDLAISAITLLELDVGVRRKERRDSAAGARLRQWLDATVRPMFRDRVLPVDERVVAEAAPLHVPDPMPALDALIAATALAHGLTLVTRNVSDMERSGVAILDPWGA
ncbi:MAG: type II toxin-antitoxin system VapC family toxin [Actinomycetales bacterium]|nr:type II toxin-antitoxin system VapC family toxin [Actinomycetales bacterium]